MSSQNEQHQQKKQMLKALIRGAYDLQKMRVATGNRVVANFRVKLGIAPGKTDDDLNKKETREILTTLRESYQRITDGITRLGPNVDYEFDGLISQFAELALVAEYQDMDTKEKENFRRIEALLQEFPIYTEFLEPIKGMGERMGGYLIAEMDPAEAQHVSSFWKYCGVDVVKVYYLEENPHNYKEVRSFQKPWGSPNTIEKAFCADWERIAQIPYEIKEDENGEKMTLWDPEEQRVAGIYRIQKQGRQAKKPFHVWRELENAKGETTWAMNLTYKPDLKKKVAYQIPTNFMMQSNEYYHQEYLPYKERLKNDPRHEDKTDLHISNMARRYLAKQFLRDLWKRWRELRGLPTGPDWWEQQRGFRHDDQDE